MDVVFGWRAALLVEWGCALADGFGCAGASGAGVSWTCRWPRFGWPAAVDLGGDLGGLAEPAAVLFEDAGLLSEQVVADGGGADE